MTQAIKAQLAECWVVTATTAKAMASASAANGGSNVAIHNARRVRESDRRHVRSTRAAGDDHGS